MPLELLQERSNILPVCRVLGTGMTCARDVPHDEVRKPNDTDRPRRSPYGLVSGRRFSKAS